MYMKKNNVYGVYIEDLIRCSKDPEYILSISYKPVNTLFAQIKILAMSLWGNNHEDHFVRVCVADTQYPIIMYKGFVVDGMHRVVKAFVMGQESLRTIELKKMPDPTVIIY